MQLAANIIVSASAILLVALGFSLIYTTTRFFHFAHGAVYASGAYLAFLLVSRAHLPLAYAILPAVILTALLGCAMEWAIYRPLRRKGTSAIILLISSLGMYVVVQNLISMVFGDDTKTIRTGAVREGIAVLGARITTIQIVTFCVALVLLAGTLALVKRTKIGKQIRAVASDHTLAGISGIDSDRVVLCTFAIGSALAGVAGILVALDVDMTPTMGMNALLMAVVAVVIGGIGSIPGLALSALLLSTIQQMGAWVLGSQWQDPLALFLLLLFLVIRPYGFLGKRTGKARV